MNIHFPIQPYPEFGALHEQRIGFSLFLFLCLIKQVVLVDCRLNTLVYTDFKPTSQEVHGDTAGTEGRRRAGLGVPRKLLRLGAVRFGNRIRPKGLIILGSCNFEWNIPTKLSSFQ
nr:MAG TPA: hypothetical protein [Caudoviricetes sp.]